jgi:pimeloyl-ACP methyl ester carboxylesterase
MRPRRPFARLLGPLVALLALVGAPACSRAPEGHYATVRGLRTYYATCGFGPTLVLLHGGAGDGAQFGNQVPMFEKFHRLVIPDLRAQGRTADRPGPLSYHDMAEDVAALMDHLQVHSFDVMGWSDGGIVALDLAIHHPRRVRHLVTFGANFTPDGLKDPDIEWLKTATAASFGVATRIAYQRVAPDPSHYEAAMNKILAMWRTQPFFTPAELRSIRSKTLIAAGERDLVRRDHTEALARAIPGARLWIVPNATHGAMLERPGLVNRTVLEFLAR